MPASLSSGEEYRICPVYASPRFGLSSPETFPEQVDFLVTSHSLPFKWDAQSRCFRAIVPETNSKHDDSPPLAPTPNSLDRHDSFSKPELAQALFTTKTTFLFPDKVRFERTARYNIKLEIIKPTSAAALNESNIPFNEDANMAIHEPMRRDTAEADCGSGHSLKNLLGLRTDAMEAPYVSPQSQLSSTTLPPVRKREELTQEMSLDPAVPNNEPRPTDQGKVLKQMSPKRKASDQIPFSTTFDIPSAFESARLALDQFQHTDLELTAKRQRVSQRRDSAVSVTTFDHGNNEKLADDESWYDGEVDCLGKFTTMSSGEAQSDHISNVWTDVEEERRLPRTKSRVYEAGLSGSKVMPSLKKKRSVRRVVFQRPKSSANVLGTSNANNTGAVQLPTPADSDSDLAEASRPIYDNLISIRDPSDTHRTRPQKRQGLQRKFLNNPYADFDISSLSNDDVEEAGPADWFLVSQGEIKRNFEEFVMKKAGAKEKPCSSDEEAYEKIFMQSDGSAEGEDWDMEADKEYNDLSDWSEMVEDISITESR